MKLWIVDDEKLSITILSIVDGEHRLLPVFFFVILGIVNEQVSEGSYESGNHRQAVGNH